MSEPREGQTIRLNRATVEEMSLEELAMEFDHKVDEFGNVARIGHVDRAELRRKIIELNKKGRDAMRPFMDWQVQTQGSSPDAAERGSLVIWRMLCERPEDPASFLLDRERYTFPERKTIFRQLSLFSGFLIQKAERIEDVDFGKALANRLHEIPLQKTLHEEQQFYFKGRNKAPEPLSEEQMNQLLQTIEERTVELGPRKPWFRPVMRFMVLAGQTVSYEFVSLEREAWKEAVWKHERGELANVTVWNIRNRAKIIPVNMVYEEMKVIADWPFPWGQISNLISPTAKEENSTKAAKSSISSELRLTAKLAGIKRKRVGYAIRSAIIKQIWDATHDHILMQTMFGLDSTDYGRYSFLKVPKAGFIQEGAEDE